MRNGAIVVGVLVGLLGGLPAAAETLVEAERLAGQDRAGTSVAVSESVRDLRQPAIGDVVVAAQHDFPDALAGASLGLPVLLTERAALPASVADHLAIGLDERPSDATAHVVGGTAVIAPSVEEQLEELGYRVQRLGGADRFQTAVRVMQAACPSCGEPNRLPPEILLASGTDFPDALVAGGAAGRGRPILLTQRDRLPESTESALAGMEPGRVVLIGGPKVIDPAIEAHLRDLGWEVARRWGETRLDTAVAVAQDDQLRPHDHRSDVAVLLARGDDFPDGLAAAGHAHTWNVPILLTQSRDELGAATAAHLRTIAHCALDLRFVGGIQAVDDDVVEQARRAATPDAGCDVEEVRGPSLVEAWTRPSESFGDVELVVEWSEPVRCGDDEMAGEQFLVLTSDGEALRPAEGWDASWACNNVIDQAPDSRMVVPFDRDPTGGTLGYTEAPHPQQVVTDLHGNRAIDRVSQVRISSGPDHD